MSIVEKVAGTQLLIDELANLSHGSILLIFSALTLCAIGLRMVQVRTAAQKQRRLERAAQISKLTAQINTQSLMLDRLQERIISLEGYVDLIDGKQQQLMANGTARKHRLQEAIDFAGRGLNRQEIARRAGVNGSEARLIGELYGSGAA